MKRLILLFSIIITSLTSCKHKPVSEKDYFESVDGHLFTTKWLRDLWNQSWLEHREAINEFRVKGYDTIGIDASWKLMEAKTSFYHLPQEQ